MTLARSQSKGGSGDETMGAQLDHFDIFLFGNPCDDLMYHKVHKNG